MKPKKTKPTTETLYLCPAGVVEVVAKSTGLRRFPPSKYKCGLFLLRPANGTRVQELPDGTVEFMPNFNELRAMLQAIDPTLAQCLPARAMNKPERRKAHFARLNAKRTRQK